MRGQHKLLMPLGGKPVIRQTLERLWGAGPQEVVVVTGHQAREISAALAEMPITIQLNPRYEEGQMTSAAVGVGALQMATDAVMMCLGDMVLLGSSDYAELVKAYLDQTD
jgi:molybdenum cofactor cytidylyltransferase